MLSCFCVILFCVLSVIDNVLRKDQQVREPSYGRHEVAGLKVVVERSGKCARSRFFAKHKLNIDVTSKAGLYLLERQGNH